ncbi:reverse transcriptase [Phytophthora megakarya]|uniref:Reverse transcriptase n=1 Tax=Phytophthora megakarya TaxID=4795 RepID=A0A225VLM1_9STRA|nr:reverse transcriptase [Phytophthora megakarya]
MKVKEEHREEVATNAGSTETSLNTARSTDQRSLERISADRHEANLDQDPDLEEKPRISLKAAAAVTADLDENLDPYTTDKDTTKSKSNLSTKSTASTKTYKKIKIKAARTKLKAPDSESEDVNKPRSTIAKDMIEQAYYLKILSKTLLQDPVLAIIQVRQIGDLTGPISKPNTSTDRLKAVKILLDLLQEAGLVAGEFDPDALFEMELDRVVALRVSYLGTGLRFSPSSATYFARSLGCEVPEITREQPGSTAGRTKSNSREPDRQEERQIPAGQATLTTNSSGSSNTLDEYFQMAINRFLKEQSQVTVQPPPLGTQDIDMESVGTLDPHSWEPERFTGKDMDEDRPRAWIGKVKSAFQRDQATGEKKYLTFADLMRQECVGIGHNVYTTEGRTKIKITLAGYLVDFFDIWIGDLSGQNAILGMDFMVPVGVRMYLADGSMRLPDEVGIPLNGRKRLYGEMVRSVILERSLRIPVGRSEETAARIKLLATEKLWVTRGERWIPTVTEGSGRIRYLVISNIGEEILRLDHRLDVDVILDQDKVPRSPGFVSVGEGSDDIDRDRTLTSTLESRPRAGIADVSQIEAESPDPERGRPSTPTTSPDADRYLSSDAEGGGIRRKNRTGIKDFEPKTENLNCQTQIKLDPSEVFDVKSPIHPTEGVNLRDPLAEGAPDAEDEDEIYYHESGDLSAEDLEGSLAVLPEIPISMTAKVNIEDLQVGDSGSATPEEIERLQQIIWKKRHLLIGKGSALPPAAKGVVCDIDVGNAKPIALRTWKVPTRFREKVAGLIKGLLAAEIIRPSTSPWASPIVIVRKSNGVDISDLFEDLDKALWYCSLDMASGFWVVPMTDRAREFSAFITPFGLFEWSRMSFGLKNAPQIYQRLVENALYGFLKISRSGDAGTTTDMFLTGIADDPGRDSVLGRRSYIDCIMIAAESWDQKCQRVEYLLEACDKWNLSISVAKSF